MVSRSHSPAHGRMSSLDIPRTTCVVSLLLFATAIGHVIVSGESKSHIKNLLYSPPVTIEADPYYTFLGEKILNAIPVSGFEGVDFDRHTMKSVYHPADLCRLQSQTLIEGAAFKVVIIGGSVPFGSEVEKVERYSDVMQSWLNNASIAVDIQNIARGGCSSQCWLNRIDPTATPELWNANMILVDLSVNDQSASPAEIQSEHFRLIRLLRSLPQQPEIAFIEELRVAKDVKADMEAHCTENDRNEKHGFFWCGRWWDMQTHAVPVLDWLNVTYISYRDGFWPQKFDVPESLPLYWNGLSHPDHKGHRLLAKLTMFLLGSVMMDARLAECGRMTSQKLLAFDNMLQRYVLHLTHLKTE